MSRPNFYMMVGLPGSGKSTYARENIEGAVICSSDSIREELIGDINSQEKNEEVFRILHKRVKDTLKSGKSVVYDACNISSKRRKAFLDELKNIDCYKVCYIMATPYDRCRGRNSARERKIPEDVIRRMYTHWNTPYYFEGWNSIHIIQSEEIEQRTLDEAMCYATELSYFNQDSPYHCETLGGHSLLTLWNLNNVVKKNRSDLNIAALLHDVGKEFTKTFLNSNGEKTDIAHYYYHENVGAYDVLNYKSYRECTILNVSIIINLHMRPYEWGKAKEPQELINKYRRLWGDALFDNVMALHAADRLAH